MWTPHRNRAPRRTAALVLVLAAALATAGCSSSGPSHRSGGGYLALGDSLAFGYQPKTVTAESAYADARNFTGYPQLVADDTGATLTNASCPGESTASMIHAGRLDDGCNAVAGAGGAPSYRSRSPLHTKYSGSQLSFATAFLRAHKHTRLVTLDIGVNDALVCYRVTPTHCTGAAASAQLAATSANLSTIFTTLRGDAGYKGTIVLLTAYAADYADTTQLVTYRALNAALGTVAKRFGVVVADGYGAFRRASAAYGGDACKAGLLTAQPSGTCDYHPSDDGQRVLADAVEKVIPKGTF